MEAKFTPGPWVAHDAGIICMESGSPLGDIPFMAIDFFSVPLLEAFPDQMKANTELIAAAPDLYEALKAIAEREKERIDGDRRKNPNGLTEASIYIIASEALAKAEGRSA